MALEKLNKHFKENFLQRFICDSTAASIMVIFHSVSLGMVQGRPYIKVPTGKGSEEQILEDSTIKEDFKVQAEVPLITQWSRARTSWVPGGRASNMHSTLKTYFEKTVNLRNFRN